ncbi:uncharacterized protein LOC126821365 [Patella vulgata]|uniref:uncharacterized protein LOC126821365 n=1 Tax=Patella vulgata TaxID=6465 RepID=UPI0024A90BCC|nr:uncharacterized protein LOC126821365 [Patella vulgata]
MHVLFIAVFKPLKVKVWVTPKRMIFAVVAVTVISFFEICNSSANFVVYTVMNKKFSNILVQMLCGLRKKNRRDNHEVVE